MIRKAPRAGRWGPEMERAFIEAPDHCEAESDIADKLRDYLKEIGVGGAELDSYSLSELLPLVPELR